MTNYTPVTPFRRAVDAACLAHQAVTQQDLPPQGVNKWEALRELSAARIKFGLSDRDLGVLQALISFHPQTVLGGNNSDLVVHPSNRSICERLNNMPCSTMRRHLGALVKAGFVIRRDSPNGKRYARRTGDQKIAFGFDLRPLAARFAEVCEAAEAVRQDADAFKRLRETVSLMRRDLAGLADYGREARPDLDLWDAFTDLAALTARDLRRKLSMDELRSISERLYAALEDARAALDFEFTRKSNSNDAKNEQHLQSSNTDPYDLELSLKQEKAEPVRSEDSEGLASDDTALPNIPLRVVVDACPAVQDYCDGPPRHWHELVRAADIVRPMMGISPSAWNEACEAMGPETAAVVLVAMLERFSEIRSPGGYLRALTTKSQNGAFSCGPMVMALLKQAA